MEEQHSLESNVKIRFFIEQDAEDWPPSNVEMLWACALGDSLYRIDNIPFFVRDIAWGDVVTAELVNDELHFKEVVEPSGHRTVRVIFFDTSAQADACSRIEGMGCSWEGSHIPSLIAVDIPPSMGYDTLREFLDAGFQADKWDYEEACLARG